MLREAAECSRCRRSTIWTSGDSCSDRRSRRSPARTGGRRSADGAGHRRNCRHHGRRDRDLDRQLLGDGTGERVRRLRLGSVATGFPLLLRRRRDDAPRGDPGRHSAASPASGALPLRHRSGPAEPAPRGRLQGHVPARVAPLRRSDPKRRAGRVRLRGRPRSHPHPRSGAGGLPDREHGSRPWSDA